MNDQDYHSMADDELARALRAIALSLGDDEIVTRVDKILSAYEAIPKWFD